MGRYATTGIEEVRIRLESMSGPRTSLTETVERVHGPTVMLWMMLIPSGFTKVSFMAAAAELGFSMEVPPVACSFHSLDW